MYACKIRIKKSTPFFFPRHISLVGMFPLQHASLTDMLLLQGWFHYKAGSVIDMRIIIKGGGVGDDSRSRNDDV